MAEHAEEPEAETQEPAASGADPVAAAMTAVLRRRRRGDKPDPKLDAFLDEQTDLIRLQKEHLHEQRALILSRLRWGRYSDRMKALLQTLGVVFSALIVVGLGVLAWRAHADHGLLVEAFSAPPSFAQRGVGGDVVATDVVNKLSAIVTVVRAQSFSSTNGVSQDAGGDVKVEIPETGVSLTEVWRATRDWLGSERKVTGTLRQSPDGTIVLTASLAGGEVFAATGAPADLDRLEQEIAEKLYSATDPINIVVYLALQGRRAEALAAAARNTTTFRGRNERADAFALWANLSADPAQILRLAHIALGIDPGLMAGHLDIAIADRSLGRDEAVLAEARRMLTLKDSDQPPQHRGKGSLEMRNAARDRIETLTGDFTAVAREIIQELGDSPSAMLSASDADARTHDLAAAANLLAQATAAGGPDPYDLLTTRYDLDVARDDWAAALGDALALSAADDKAVAASSDPDEKAAEKAALITAAQTRYQPLLAEAQAHTGNVAAAEATIAGTPLDCYACLRTRGRIAALSGDMADADRWFAEAVRQGPSLPFAYAEWGQALLARGDTAGAIAKLQLAHQQGPHFADPLEAWGEALIAKRDYADAVPKFAEADKDAPKWGRNHLRWGEALMLSGRYAEARAQYDAANGLDLSKPDRAALNVLLARTAKGPLHG